MESVNGEFIMKDCTTSSLEVLHSFEDLCNLIQSIGFLPLFANQIPGFSVEERVPASVWWTGDTATDPWEWRMIGAKHPDIVYGKFFDKKAGFISKDWFPAFANYRRDGYDFEALFEDELSSYRAKRIMDALEMDDNGRSREIMSFELKSLAGFGKKADGSSGEKNFEGVLTELQMQSYLIMSDFGQKKNKKGQEYGWHIAAIETPETKWGREHVSSAYHEAPGDSWKKIVEQVKRFLPEAKDELVYRVLGYRHPWKYEEERKKPQRPKLVKITRSQQLPWPENLITEIGVDIALGADTYTELSDDQMEGLLYAISTLTEREQDVIRYRYENHLTLQETGERMGLSNVRPRQIAEKAIRKMGHPTRIVFVREGYAGHLEKEQEKRVEAQKIMDLTDEERARFLEQIFVDDIGLSNRPLNCLKRAGLMTLADVAKFCENDVDHLNSIRNMGRRSKDEVIGKLEEYGLIFDHSAQ